MGEPPSMASVLNSVGKKNFASTLKLSFAEIENKTGNGAVFQIKK
jgi:hypothetical protein